MSIHARIAELGITLPEPAKPVASYVSYVRSGEQIFISGQLSNDAGGGIKGTVGVDVTPEQAAEAARLCGINLLAQINAAVDGDLVTHLRHRFNGAFLFNSGFGAKPEPRRGRAAAYGGGGRADTIRVIHERAIIRPRAQADHRRGGAADT